MSVCGIVASKRIMTHSYISWRSLALLVVCFCCCDLCGTRHRWWRDLASLRNSIWFHVPMVYFSCISMIWQPWSDTAAKLWVYAGIGLLLVNINKTTKKGPVQLINLKFYTKVHLLSERNIKTAITQTKPWYSLQVVLWRRCFSSYILFSILITLWRLFKPKRAMCISWTGIFSPENLFRAVYSLHCKCEFLPSKRLCLSGDSCSV